MTSIFEPSYLTADSIRKSERELGETKEVRRMAIAQLKALLDQEGNISYGPDNKWMLQYLRVKKFNVLRAFNSIKEFCREKKAFPEVMRYDLDGFKAALSNELVNISPCKDKDGCIVISFNVVHWNVNELKLSDIAHYCIMTVLFCNENPNTQVCGYKIICDLRNITWTHIRHAHPKYLYLIAKGIKSIMPGRFKEFHFISDSVLTYYVSNIFKLVFSEKLKKRLQMHSSNLESLHKFISPEYLSKDLGGSCDLRTAELVHQLDGMKHRYDVFHHLGYNSVPTKKK